jgi:hypothetical protein
VESNIFSWFQVLTAINMKTPVISRLTQSFFIKIHNQPRVSATLSHIQAEYTCTTVKSNIINIAKQVVGCGF